MNENRNSLHHNNTFENKSMLEKILLYQGKFKIPKQENQYSFRKGCV